MSLQICLIGIIGIFLENICKRNPFKEMCLHTCVCLSYMKRMQMFTLKYRHFLISARVQETL